MFCSNCGTELPNEAKFCNYCGKSVIDAIDSGLLTSDSELIKLIPAKCTNCGGNLTVDPAKKNAVCPYCNSSFIVDEAIQNYNIDTVEGNINVNKATINVNQKSAEERYYICPKCHSTNIQRLSIVYKEGRTDINIRSKDDSWTNNKEFKTTGVQETELAKSIAPPKRENYIEAIIGTGVLYVIALIVIAFLVPKELSSLTQNIIFWGITLLFAFLLFCNLKDVYNYNKIYPRKIDEWMHSWICKKCGHIFVKDDLE